MEWRSVWFGSSPVGTVSGNWALVQRQMRKGKMRHAFYTVKGKIWKGLILSVYHMRKQTVRNAIRQSKNAFKFQQSYSKFKEKVFSVFKILHFYLIVLKSYLGWFQNLFWSSKVSYGDIYFEPELMDRTGKYPETKMLKHTIRLKRHNQRRWRITKHCTSLKGHWKMLETAEKPGMPKTRIHTKEEFIHRSLENTLQAQ